MLHLETGFCKKISPRESSDFSCKQVSRVLGGSCRYQVSHAVWRSDHDW